MDGTIEIKCDICNKNNVRVGRICGSCTIMCFSYINIDDKENIKNNADDTKISSHENQKERNKIKRERPTDYIFIR